MQFSDIEKYRIAVVLPCYNEEAAIRQVLTDFSAALPGATIYVFNNNSTDKTADIARDLGAVVIDVKEKGKGNVVRRIFADVDADIYIMADGDATYDSEAAPDLIAKLVSERLDMVVGCRADNGELANYRQGHRFGNRLLTSSVRHIFGGEFTDMLSGYRVFSRRYAKSFPSESSGFEIETELTVHALEMSMPYGELSTAYGARPEGSASKLSTYKDGIKILKTICRLYMFERPLACFSWLSVFFAVASIVLAFPLILEYYDNGLVPRLPTAVLVTGLAIFSLLLFIAGIILDSVARGRREIRRFVYLMIPALSLKK